MITGLLFFFILVAAIPAIYLHSQHIKRMHMEDEPDPDVDTKMISKETGEIMPVIPHPYSPWSKRIVFLQPSQTQWWDNLSAKDKSSIYNDIQGQVKSGHLIKVHDDKGNLIGFKNGPSK